MRGHEARTVLRDGGKFSHLLLAVGVVGADPRSTVNHLLLGLAHRGGVGEQAAFALYRRTDRPLPRNAARIEMSYEKWVEWLLDARPESLSTKSNGRSYRGSFPATTPGS